MATPKPPVSTTPAAGMSASSIAESGAGLIRLGVTAITLPITVANAVGVGMSRFLTGVTSALDGNAVPADGNEIIKATNDLVKATTGLYTSVLNVAIGGLETLTRSIDAAVAETKGPSK
ncbi:hypothetical protein K2Z83_02310 [Oscillochloris sp. ZM17-4]|uniref:hypothetical protein n=1 Tax=Oscillochloris sp. ZM17-4 TaxID=2866714 RepID=UPI001C734D13|nr:hypothetical protein [Oscillochloris sp. ZM17-4]MBX0326526.1 hypothetical protein [Oscillochloris sp. ZM17-4]